MSNVTITFYGAAHEVTGSCHLVDTGKKKYLFDCGMFQGSEESEAKNAEAFPFAAKDIDAVFLSHAHNDHSGRLPLLVKAGFHGPIYGTKGSVELAKLIWDDAYRIMQYNHKKYHKPMLYSEAHIHEAEHMSHGLDYGEVVDLGDGNSVVFKDAGHIFGASFIELHVDGKKICFSGDIGNDNVPILKETQQLGDVDVLLCESTYGDRLHESKESRTDILLNLIKEGVARGGTIMMPAFSLERTQEILYNLNQMLEHDSDMPRIPIFLDSPLAIRALPVYRKYSQYYDKEALLHYSHGDDFFEFPGLKLTLTKEESKAINHVPGPKLIIAGSGMMTGGRILHHAKRYLSDPNAMLVLVGYQAHNTLGRKLYDGADEVMIHQDKIPVAAKVMSVSALSAHGDQQKLIRWIKEAKALPKQVYCVHGEPHAATELAHHIKGKLGVDAFVPDYGETITVL